ncbi:trihelix transcription factor ASR3 isoform X2 [Hordeum vulgare subsp. vulgare]|nr:trihelix transcription factor ASR3 isoform X2 [Hordeum vulgare subsp. vulgare]
MNKLTRSKPPCRTEPLTGLTLSLSSRLPQAPTASASASASMDPRGADIPCIVQALPSVDPSVTASDSPCIVQALAASPSKPQALTPAARDQPPPAFKSSRPPSPRRTRSGRAPEWTAAETLALVAAVAAVEDDGWARSVSAFQKWAIVAENIAFSDAGGAPSRRRGRAAGECKRKWEALEAEYGAVRHWEARTGGKYWRMGAAARRKAGLPAEFDAEVYGIMDALIRVDEALLGGAGGGGGDEVLASANGDGGGGGDTAEVGEEEGGGGGGDTAEVGEEEGGDAGVEEEEEDSAAEDGDRSEEEMQVDGGNANASDDLGCEMETDNEPKKSQADAWELANKLSENAEHIHMILSGEADEDGGHHNAPAYAVSPDAMETTRQKADELIKSLGGLVSYLNQFTDLVKENGIEDVVSVN